MGDQTIEWKIHEFPLADEGDGGGFIELILDKGWRLGKKIVIAGVAISSAPIVLPPLMLFSTLGFAFAVPFGLVFASYACTEKIMSKLLPIPVATEGIGCFLEKEMIEGFEKVEDNWRGNVEGDFGREEESLKGTMEETVEWEGSERGMGEGSGNGGGGVERGEGKMIEEQKGTIQETVDDRLRSERELEEESGIVEGDDKKSIEEQTCAIDETADNNIEESGIGGGVNGEEEKSIEEQKDVVQETADDAVAVEVVKSERGMEVENGFGGVIKIKEEKPIEEMKGLIEEMGNGTIDNVRSEWEMVEENGIDGEGIEREEGKPIEEKKGAIEETANDDVKDVGAERKVEKNGIIEEGIKREEEKPIEEQKGTIGEIANNDVVDVLSAKKEKEEENGIAGGIKGEEEKPIEVTKVTVEETADDAVKDVGSDREMEEEKVTDKEANVSEITFQYSPAIEEIHERKEPAAAAATVDHSSVPMAPAVRKTDSDSEYASAIEEHHLDNTDTASADSMEHSVSSHVSKVVSEKEAFESPDEGLYNEEKIWEQINAIRIIVGYKSVLHASCAEELDALYIFTGVEPLVSFKDSFDLVEVNNKLRFLKAVVGVK
eukprot:TRINITY_DN20843_c0_g1_i1.p1 TRINITY_DN20843_c0_g1~~TRINITY_DN20843_c0_g1_i1.p1  ORF type:complete len:605 (+),score=183.43 TRINITY_DN20843_c0_g1_i1:177-1991(+)